MPRYSVDSYVQGVLSQDRRMLAKTITLIESILPADRELGQDVLTQLLPASGQSLRVGISGPPGVGKSTFIEVLGLHILAQGRRVAILAVDPSSSLSGGSLLGDKTRMGRLLCNPDVFIRPSPAGETLGGVARKTREAMLIVEAAGYDTVLVETVGVGQSEIVVAGMVDFFALLALPNAGDELQGIKRGIMEMADGVIVNKADGSFLASANHAARILQSALQLLHRPRGDWETPVLMASAQTGKGVPECWDTMTRFHKVMSENGWLQAKRQQQNLDWMWAMVRDDLQRRFTDHPRVRDQLPGLRQSVESGKMTPVHAATALLKAFTD